ncbi:phosphatidylinositide phosphatase SAC2-like [Corticium candelabrum]|uniref:phosphatidylinositide phosphatase SAC2-like n=1 Tax=Corticium candelabrum TaxID=121492 RepID=UPI002E26FFB6|nr:phosphatidylinositide phosphatase SAC2-like [Corticium candelabrum]
MSIEVYETYDRYILKCADSTLWCSRLTGSLEVHPASMLEKAWHPQCRGCVHAVVGKLRFSPKSHWKLILVGHSVPVARQPHWNGEIFRINKIVSLSLSLPSQGGRDSAVNEEQHQNQKTANACQQELLQQYEKISDQKLNKQEKIEKRLEEELHRMFTGSESFYFSFTADLTNSMQRQMLSSHDKLKPLWKQADKRFFWNYEMLNELITASETHGTTASVIDQWIIPVVQGFVQSEVCTLPHSRQTSPEPQAFSNSPKSSPKLKRQSAPVSFSGHTNDSFDLVIISRRSRYRAGTRYKRRGIDKHGHVANYVETEFIVNKPPNIASFVQVRGSIPVFWSQPCIKYRPAPRLHGTEEENREAFATHFGEQLMLYDWIVSVNLVDRTGRERAIGLMYEKQAAVYNNENLFFLSFDFHEYCKGMHYERIQVLVENLRNIISRMRFCWVGDRKGLLSKQTGVFRVNCMDCLDRTNVVQSAFARATLHSILCKFGLLDPEERLPHACQTLYQEIWANNGDAISRQYAGTDALKGDFTRTGERRFAGMVRDGMKSANRYYVSRFRDTYRQLVINTMQGSCVMDDFVNIEPETDVEKEDEQWTMQKEASLVSLVQCCKKRLIDDSEMSGTKGWALVVPSAFRVDSKGEDEDEDVILLMTESSFYIVRYDETNDEVTEYERLPLDEVKEVVIGGEKSRGGRHCIQFNCGDNTLKTFTTVRAHHQTRDVMITLLEIAETFTTLQKQQGDVKAPVSRQVVLQTKSEKSRRAGIGRVIQLTQKYLLKESLWKRNKSKSKSVSGEQVVESKRSLDDKVKDEEQEDDKDSENYVLEETAVDDMRQRTGVISRDQLSLLHSSMKASLTQKHSNTKEEATKSVFYVSNTESKLDDYSVEHRQRTGAASTSHLSATHALMKKRQSHVNVTTECLVDDESSGIELGSTNKICQEVTLQAGEEVTTTADGQHNVGIEVADSTGKTSPAFPSSDNDGDDNDGDAVASASCPDVPENVVKAARRMSRTNFLTIF